MKLIGTQLPCSSTSPK